jgi:hypothetical protein
MCSIDNKIIFHLPITPKEETKKKTFSFKLILFRSFLEVILIENLFLNAFNSKQLQQVFEIRFLQSCI